MTPFEREYYIQLLNIQLEEKKQKEMAYNG